MDKKLTESEQGEVGTVFGAYNSFRGARRARIAYVGMSITTGKRCYDVLERHGVRTVKELQAACGDKALLDLVIKPNIAEGIALADRLGREKGLLFIAPSVFEARRWKWSQDAYMSLWYRVLGEVAGAHFVSDGWEYSLGGVKEVFFSNLMRWGMIRPNASGAAKEVFRETFGLRCFYPEVTWAEERIEYLAMRAFRIFDAGGRELRIDTAIDLCVKAVLDLRRRGFEYEELLGIAYQLMQVPILSLGQWGEYVEQKDFDTPVYHAARRQLQVLCFG